MQIWLVLAFDKSNLAFDLAPIHSKPSLGIWGEGLGVVLGVLKIFGVPECPRKIDLEAQCPPRHTHTHHHHPPILGWVNGNLD